MKLSLDYVKYNKKVNAGFHLVVSLAVFPIENEFCLLFFCRKLEKVDMGLV